MSIQNNELLKVKRKHLLQVLAMAGSYCGRHRMIDVDLRAVPLASLEAVANEIVDLFLERVADLHKASPPEEGATPKEGFVRYRGHPRDQ